MIPGIFLAYRRVAETARQVVIQVSLRMLRVSLSSIVRSSAQSSMRMVIQPSSPVPTGVLETLYAELHVMSTGRAIALSVLRRP